MKEFTIIILLWIHFVADFMLQNDKMALNKSNSIKWLGFHSIIYGITFSVLIPYIFNFYGFVLLFGNTILHFIVDFITSKITTYLWKKEERHWFFVVIGIDQTIHMTTLILMYFFYIEVLSRYFS